MNKLSFQELLDASMTHLKTGTTITIPDVALSLIVSLLCAGIIYFTYLRTYQGVLYQKSYNMSLVLACLITTMTIMAVSGNLILSLGMVGALSIVRFRAAVKDPLDVVYMFWAIGIGIANGVAFFKISLASSLFISVTMFVMGRIKATHAPCLLIVKYEKGAEEFVMETLKLTIKKYKIKTKTVKQQEVELTAELRLRDPQAKLVNTLNEHKEVHDAALLSYSSALNEV